MKRTLVLGLLLSATVSLAVPESQLKQRIPEILEFYQSGELGTFQSNDDVTLSYGAFVNPGAKANLVLLEGRSEAKEKYAELIFDLYGKGASVFILDFRGQGWSHRALDDPQKGHINDYLEYVTDVSSFLDKIVVPKSNGLPIHAISHSMGGNVLSLAMARGETRFKKAVLGSPMLDIPTKPFPNKLAWFVLWLQGVIGGDDAFLMGRGHYNFNESNRVTGSQVRFQFAHQLRKENRKSLVGAPTVRWARVSLEATWQMRRDAHKISIPVLMFQAGNDLLVLSEGQDYVCIQIPDCRKVVFPTGRHELFFETDDIRDKVLAELTTFLELD